MASWEQGLSIPASLLSIYVGSPRGFSDLGSKQQASQCTDPFAVVVVCCTGIVQSGDIRAADCVLRGQV